MTDPHFEAFWQYKVKIYHLKNFTGTKALETEQDLNDLGADRWECFEIIADGDFLMYNFKRLMRQV